MSVASGKPVEVVDYDPKWPEQFGALRDRIWPAIRDIAIGLEHVGSTAVTGLAAKPIIDLDIVIPSAAIFPEVVSRLAALGYRHQGNLGIEDREAFCAEAGGPNHNLYCCPRESRALRNHLMLRDHLRAHPEDAAAYGRLKRELAAQYRFDRSRYLEGKTGFIVAILDNCETSGS